MKDPFPAINYPPGAINDPDAPWNLPDIESGVCFGCKTVINIDDMSEEELRSYDDNEDGEFLCDACNAIENSINYMSDPSDEHRKNLEIYKEE